MRINETGLGGPRPTPANTAATSNTTAKQAGARPTDAAVSYEPSAELARLTRLAVLEPEVREDRVREAALRLAEGQYDTPEALARTADAILASPD